MARRDLTEFQLQVLTDWAEGSGNRGLIPQDRAQMIMAAVAELKRLRENEANTRFLMEIEGEV